MIWRLVIVVIISCVFSSQAATKADEVQIKKLENELSGHWIEQNKKSYAPVKGKCWEKSKRRAIQGSLISLSYELDLVDWLTSQNLPNEESRYRTIYDSSRDGLQRRMFNNGYRLIRSVNGDDLWTSLIYQNSEGHTANLRVLTPTSLDIYKARLISQLVELASHALDECKSKNPIPTRSLGLIVYSVLPHISDSIAIKILGSSIAAWNQSVENKKPKLESRWLSRIGLQISLLNWGQIKILRQSIDTQTKRRLANSTRNKIQKIERQKLPARSKVAKLWRYQSLLVAVGEVNVDRYKNLTQPVSDDPNINLSFLETAELLVLAKSMSQDGVQEASANILRNLLTWEVGTADTGLNLMRPIGRDNSIITPYPIWLPLVPAQHELMAYMKAQDNQLLAEQYKTTRMFSRDQYVSGIAEEGFWLNFWNVVN